MLRVRHFLFLVLMLCSTAYAQTNKHYGKIKGKLVNASTKAPFNDLTIAIPSIKAYTISFNDGDFVIAEVPYNNYDLVISGDYAESKTIKVNVKDEVVDLGTIEITPNNSKSASEETVIPTIAVDDNMADDFDNNGGQNMLGFFTPAQDQFLFNTYFTFGMFRYRPRGMFAQELQFNGFILNDLASGFSSFTQLGGLNEVIRSRNITYGLKPSDYSFGVMNGITNYIDGTAANLRKGTSITYTAANRTYFNRLMVTHNTGLLKNGWAFSISGSKRWAEEGYYKGTYYDGYSLYAGATKKMKSGMLNLSVLGSYLDRGLSGPTIGETYELTGDHYYNPYWGYQAGKKRSGRTSKIFQPFAVANYTHHFSERTKWNTALGYQMGKNRRGGVDFLNGYNPAPDYYRNLPSYYLNGVTTPNQVAFDSLTDFYHSNPNALQMQWDNFYSSNYMNTRTIYNANGTTDSVTGKQSIFVVSDRVDDLRKIVLNSTIDHSFSEKLNIQGGVNVIRQSDHYYRELTDLLGGDFFLNNNQFAAQANPGNPSATQNNLLVQNQLVKVGDKYGYEYFLNILQASAWAQAQYSLEQISFFGSLKATFNSYDRDGKTKNGIFPNESYGKSDAHNFLGLAAKGGVRYQPNARNIFFANVGFAQDAPNIHNVFISEITRNTTIDNPKLQNTVAVEGGYQYKTTRLTATLTGYLTDISNAVLIKRFFNDDPDIQSYVNYVMENMSTRSIGAELTVRYNITDLITLNASASANQSFYTNRPDVSIYQDNDPTATSTNRTVYIKNFYLGAGPQSVYTAGLSYRPTNSTRFGFNVNYLDRNYLDVNPERRTQLALDMVPINSTQWNQIVDQTKLPSAYTVDVNGSKTWNMKKLTKLAPTGSQLVLNVGINNVLNNQDIILYGYEQLRFDYKNKNANKFPNKYVYAMGINFFANLTLRF